MLGKQEALDKHLERLTRKILHSANMNHVTVTYTRPLGWLPAVRGLQSVSRADARQNFARAVHVHMSVTKPTTSLPSVRWRTLDKTIFAECQLTALGIGGLVHNTQQSLAVSRVPGSDTWQSADRAACWRLVCRVSSVGYSANLQSLSFHRLPIFLCRVSRSTWQRFCRVLDKNTQQRPICQNKSLPSDLCRVQHSVKPLPCVNKVLPSVFGTRQNNGFP